MIFTKNKKGYNLKKDNSKEEKFKNNIRYINIEKGNINSFIIKNNKDILDLISILNNNDKIITRIVYVKNNRILFEEIINIRIKKDYKIDCIELKKTITNRLYDINADGFYIITNSKYDDKKIIEKSEIEVVNEVKEIKGFKKYIVLKGNTYICMKNHNGKIKIKDMEEILNYNEDTIEKKLIEYLRLNIKIMVDYDLISLVYSMDETKKYLWLILFDKNNKIRFLKDMSQNFISRNSINEINKVFTTYKRIFKGDKLLIISDNQVLFRKSKKLVDGKYIFGCIGYLIRDNKVVFYDKYKIDGKEERIYELCNNNK